MTDERILEIVDEQAPWCGGFETPDITAVPTDVRVLLSKDDVIAICQKVAAEAAREATQNDAA